jgi:hypothetical protein
MDESRLNEIIFANKFRKIFVMSICIYSQRISVGVIFVDIVAHTDLGSTNIWPTMFGRCTLQKKFMVPGLFAMKDTVWISPL